MSLLSPQATAAVILSAALLRYTKYDVYLLSLETEHHPHVMYSSRGDLLLPAVRKQTNEQATMSGFQSRCLLFI